MFSVFSNPFLSHGMCFGEKCHIAAETMKHGLCRLYLETYLAGHDKLLVIKFSSEDITSLLHVVSLHILTQFFIASLVPVNDNGVSPSSSNTPTLVVCLCTPKSSLQNLIKRVSMGLFYGNLRAPQKSLAYNIIGWIRVLKSLIVIVGYLRNEGPI